MSLKLADEDWMLQSRTQRVTKTVRLDLLLLEEMERRGIRRGQISDVLNLALKRFLEAESHESKQSKGLRKENTESQGD